MSVDVISGSPQAANSGQQAATAARASLQDNPFWVLGASARDKRYQIEALSEEQSLILEQETCDRARSDLLTPRSRLGAEIAWLPGVSPKLARELVEKLIADPYSIDDDFDKLPTLACLNLFAAQTELAPVPADTAAGVYHLYHLAVEYHELNAEEILRDVNEDRVVSGFPKVPELEHVEQELAARRRFYLDVMKRYLDRVPSRLMVEVMTATMEEALKGSDSHGLPLLDDLADVYEVHCQGFLELEEQNCRKLMAAIRELVPRSAQAASPLITQLEKSVRSWDFVAQPVQLSMRSRGITHAASRELAMEIRDLAIELYNKNDQLALAQRLTSLLSDVFAEVPDVQERVDEDREQLERLELQQKKSEEDKRRWASEITFETEVGLLFKDRFSLSPTAIEWKQQRFPLESITRVRWGAIRHSTNGIPTGVEFTIAFGTNAAEAVMKFRDKQLWEAIIPKLWKAIAVPLSTDLLLQLKNGERINFGHAAVFDSSVVLVKQGKKPELVHVPWNETEFVSSDGSLVIRSTAVVGVMSRLSYIDTPNVHILENLLGIRQKLRAPKLSKLLD